jgi:radical SAM-linked protein
MAARIPEGPPPEPTVQRVRLRYAKRGRLRFTSHRDFARAFERALRRAQVPMAYSAGFSPHPKVSYANACPTGTASEAEYLELALARRCDPTSLGAALDEALPAGLDVVEVRETPTERHGSLADRLQASAWEIRLPGPAAAAVESAVEALLATDEVLVERLTKSGVRTFDARGAVVRLTVRDAPAADVGVPAGSEGCAILDMVVRHVTPAVRPDDVLSALRSVADLAPPVPPLVIRLAQGPLDEAAGTVGDPLASVPT